MIFRLLQIRKMASEAKQDPGKFASGQAGGWFLDMLIFPALIILSVLIIFFIFGFTHFLGGPYLFFKVIFFLILALVLFIFYFLRKIYKLIKSVTHNTVKGVIKIGSKVIE